MLNFIKQIINAIIPPRCLVCSKAVNFDNHLCVECFEKITFITTPYCKHCGTPFARTVSDGEKFCIHCLDEKNKDNIRISRSAVVYDEFSKKIILDFKFLDHIENKKLMANWLNMASSDIFNLGVDLIIPVPLHFLRILSRKYNQSAILADELAKIRKIDVAFDCLKKTKRTLPQVMCSGAERKKNIKGAFKVYNIQKIKGKRILLIDDVYTTGSTLKECAKVLIKAGAKSVDTLTVAKVC